MSTDASNQAPRDEISRLQKVITAQDATIAQQNAAVCKLRKTLSGCGQKYDDCAICPNGIRIGLQYQSHRRTPPHLGLKTRGFHEKDKFINEIMGIRIAVKSGTVAEIGKELIGIGKDADSILETAEAHSARQPPSESRKISFNTRANLLSVTSLYTFDTHWSSQRKTLHHQPLTSNSYYMLQR